MSDLPDDLRELCEQLQRVRRRAKSMGIFTDDRELLECPHCGLMEDVASSGLLITCNPDSLGVDTGKRFEELPSNRFRCPGCGEIILEI